MWLITGLNLLSMSDTFKAMQTYSKHQYFTASQALCSAEVADGVLLGEVICLWLWSVGLMSLSVTVATTFDTGEHKLMSYSY